MRTKAVGFLAVGLLAFAAATPIRAAEVTQKTGDGSPCSPTQNGNGNIASCYVMPPPVIPKNSAASTVLMNCEMEMLPRKVGPNEVVPFLSLWSASTDIVPITDQVGGMVVDHSLARAFSTSGKEWQWNPAGATPYKCEILNYSDGPILEVKLALDVTFYDAIKLQNAPNTISIGPQIFERPWIIEVPKIDIGPSNNSSFYIYNGTEDRVVKVLLPKTVQLRHLGETKSEVVTLDASRVGGEVPIIFWPIRK